MSYLRAALGNGRQNDIVDQGKVNRNFELDVKLIKQKKRNLAGGEKNTRFPGNSGNEAFSIYKGELMFTVRSQRPGSYLRNNPAVFSNWLGHELITTNPTYDPNEESLESYEDAVEFVGIAQGSGSVFDDKTKHQVLSLAGTSGGTQTITNNSNYHLKNGDLLMWKAPTKKEHNKDYKGSERWLAQLEVYNPLKHRLTTRSLFHYSQHRNDYDENDSLSILYKQEASAFWLIIEQLKAGDESKLSSLLTNLFVIMERLNFIVKRRVFAVVLSPAEPGEKVDILLKNSYEIY